MNLDLTSGATGFLMAVAIFLIIWMLMPKKNSKLLLKLAETSEQLKQSREANNASEDKVAELMASIAADAKTNKAAKSRLNTAESALKQVLNENKALRKRAIPFDIGTAVQWKKNGKMRHGIIYDHVAPGEQYAVPTLINGVAPVAVGAVDTAKPEPTYIIIVQNGSTLELRRPAPSLVKLATQ